MVFPDWDAPLVEIAAPFSVGENIVFQPGETLRVARKKAGTDTSWERNPGNIYICFVLLLSSIFSHIKFILTLYQKPKK